MQTFTHLSVLNSEFKILCVLQVTVISDLLYFWVENPPQNTCFITVLKLTAYLELMITARFSFCMPTCKQRRAETKTHFNQT